MTICSYDINVRVVAACAFAHHSTVQTRPLGAPPARRSQRTVHLSTAPPVAPAADRALPCPLSWTGLTLGRRQTGHRLRVSVVTLSPRLSATRGAKCASQGANSQRVQTACRCVRLYALWTRLALRLELARLSFGALGLRGMRGMQHALPFFVASKQRRNPH